MRDRTNYHPFWVLLTNKTQYDKINGFVQKRGRGACSWVAYPCSLPSSRGSSSPGLLGPVAEVVARSWDSGMQHQVDLAAALLVPMIKMWS
jgi:hypothetical protein